MTPSDPQISPKLNGAKTKSRHIKSNQTSLRMEVFLLLAPSEAVEFKPASRAAAFEEDRPLSLRAWTASLTSPIGVTIIFTTLPMMAVPMVPCAKALRLYPYLGSYPES